MFYDKELDFLKRIYKKYNLSVITFDPAIPMKGIVGSDLLKAMGSDVENMAFKDVVGEINDRTVYRITDYFQCHYVFLKLPQNEGGFVLMIGPYATELIEAERVLEYAELLEIGPKQTAQMIRYYKNVPMIPESSRLFTVIDAFCDVLWGGEGSSYVTINKNDDLPFSSIAVKEFTDEDSPELDMGMMERRYEMENQIMEAVKHGQTFKSEMFTSAFSPGAFEQRLSDSVRNSKNYMIIMNTLLRKAAEYGGVHPFYLDKMSSKYAAEIEAIKNIKTLPYFMKKIFEDYCGLVNKHSTKNYSTLIKNVIIYVDSDLSADISLKQLAEMNGVSSTYLSTTFKKETGKAFIDYLNSKRIDMAKHLLKTTKLQIQTIAQHCGFLDMQYFSKVFKKYTGMAPREYRESKINKG